MYVPKYLDIVNESEYLQFIQEVQFNNPKLSKIENLIEYLRNKYLLLNEKINTDPKIKEISSLFEEIFGFNSCQFSIEQSKFNNAYTVPLSSKIDSWNYKKCIKRTDEGLQFTAIAKANVAIYITSNLFFDKQYSNREILAILLHEIGHNFSDSINNTLGIYSNFKKVLLIPQLINPVNITNISNIARGSITKYNEYMRKNYPEVVSSFNSLKIFFNKFLYEKFIFDFICF